VLSDRLLCCRAAAVEYDRVFDEYKCLDGDEIYLI
jgi:hypothetical protein